MRLLTLIIGIITLNVGIAGAQSVVAKREFNNTLKAYFETKNALSKDQVADADLGSQKLIKIINEFPVKTLSAEQLELWNKETPLILEGAKLISKEKELKAQRAPFENVSKGIYNLTKGFNMHNQTVYLQYCPMAKKAWLNEVEAIQNPFYGSKMFACGEVKEALVKP